MYGIVENVLVKMTGQSLVVLHVVFIVLKTKL